MTDQDVLGPPMAGWWQWHDKGMVRHDTALSEVYDISLASDGQVRLGLRGNSFAVHIPGGECASFLAAWRAYKAMQLPRNKESKAVPAPDAHQSYLAAIVEAVLDGNAPAVMAEYLRKAALRQQVLGLVGGVAPQWLVNVATAIEESQKVVTP